MSDKYYLVKENNQNMKYSPVKILDNPNLKVLDHEVRQKIMQKLSEKPMFAAQLARELEIHEQKVYYHLKQLVNTGVLEEAGKEEIRGTVAKKYQAKHTSFAYSIDENWKEFNQLLEPEDSELRTFLDPFIEKRQLNCDFVVGSPDPHGPYKSYARDGHYATDLALFLGRYCEVPDKFSVKIDVDVKAEKTHKRNMIVVGGPGTNIITQELNEFLPIKFDIKESEEGFLCSGIVSEKTGRRTTEEKAGIIARIPNPWNPDNSVLILAGFRCIGSKTAVIGLTRYADKILQKFNDQKQFAAIVDGFDMDGDGKIDSVELIE